MNHTSTVLGDRGSLSRNDPPLEEHENRLGRDYHEGEPFWKTDSGLSPASLHDLLDNQDIDRILTDVVPPSLHFRKVETGHSKPRSSKSRPVPETLPTHGSQQPIEEDAEAVAFDEALDDTQQVENHDHDEQVENHDHDERDESDPSQVNANSTRRLPPLLLSRRDKGQLEIVRRTSKRDKTNFAKASSDFISWKRLLKEIPNPESKSPSSIELRILHGVLALDSAHSITTFLSYSSPEHKQKARNRILLYTTLRHAPEKGAMVLQALLSTSRLPFYMVEDSLSFLAYQLRQMEAGLKESCAQKLADLVVQTAQLGQKGYIRPPQNTIYSIMDALPPTQLEDWFHQLIAHELPLHKYTILQFASRFAKMSATKDLSLDIWRDLCETKSLDINTPLGASLCTSLLTFQDDDLHAFDENLATPAELFQCLLDLGLIPNVITYTTIIHSLCVKKDLQTAMEVFEVMKQHGVQPDKFTYSVMMNGFKSCGDFGTMLSFASNARDAGGQDAVVWNDMIHATFLACLKEPRVPGGVRRARCVVWGPMNAIFARFFKPEPLRTLITGRFTDVRVFMEQHGFVPSRMQGAFHEIRQLHPQELIQPSSSTLSLMILGFVRHLPRPYDVVSFYDHFKNLLREGDPVAQMIVQEQGSIVHDVVLRSLIKWKGMLRIMLSIIRDMMTDVSPAAVVPPPLSLQTFEQEISNSATNSATNNEDPSVDFETSKPGADTTTAADDVAGVRMGAVMKEESALSLSNASDHSGEARPPIRHPRPSVYTWSILTKAFMSNRLPQEAEHILKLMQVHGVKPNIVTWNTLAAGHAKMGNTKQAVETMRRLEGAGFKNDDWTMRAFSYISDKAGAIRLMEQKVEENKLTKAAIEGSDQGRKDEAEFYEEMGQEDQVEDDLSLDYEQGLEIIQEGGHWPPNETMPPPGKETEIQAQSPRQPVEEPRPISGQASQAAPQVETQKPIAKAPAPPKPNLGAWDDFLWDHAADAGTEEQGEREESAV